MKATEAKREVILRAANGLFLKHGLRGTSMEAIAREAGIAKPTLYAYFADKAAVFDALAEQITGAWRADFRGALDGEGDVVKRAGAALTAWHKASLRLRAGSPHAAALYGGHERAAAPFGALEADLVAALETALEDAGVERARLVAQVLMAAAAGVAHRAVSPAELGPALRLLSERLIRPEII